MFNSWIIQIITNTKQHVWVCHKNFLTSCLWLSACWIHKEWICLPTKNQMWIFVAAGLRMGDSPFLPVKCFYCEVAAVGNVQIFICLFTFSLFHRRRRFCTLTPVASSHRTEKICTFCTLFDSHGYRLSPPSLTCILSVINLPKNRKNPR